MATMNDVRTISIEELEKKASSLRGRILDVVSRNGGHLTSSLGAVRSQQPDDVLEQHAFAGARPADDHGALAALDLQVDVVQHALFAERLADAA